MRLAGSENSAIGREREDKMRIFTQKHGFIEMEPTLIDPGLARELLTGNTENRKISKAVVNRYKSEIELNKWDLTHQGILIGRDGLVIDGQHRLHAIVEAGKSVNMYIYYSEDVTSPLGLMIDKNYYRKSHWIYDKKKRDWSVAACFCTVLKNKNKQDYCTDTRNSDHEVLQICDAIEEYGSMVGYTSRKHLTTSSIRGGIIAAMIAHRALPIKLEKIAAQYMCLYGEKYTEMEPATAELHKYIKRQTEAGSRVMVKPRRPSSDIFVRSFLAFMEPARRSIAIKDETFNKIYKRIQAILRLYFIDNMGVSLV